MKPSNSPDPSNVHSKVSDRICADLLRQISQGDLLPGDPVDESDLARHYGVSKTPVREALMQLKAQGLVNSPSRGPMVVAKMDLRQLLSLWELLAQIEAIAVKFACERMTNEEIEKLIQLHEQSRRLAEQEDHEQWKESNRQFHELIYQGSRNPYLRQEVLRIRTQTGVYRKHAFGALGTTLDSYAQHDKIVQALRLRDAGLAQQAMLHHLLPANQAGAMTTLIMNIPQGLLAS